MDDSSLKGALRRHWPWALLVILGTFVAYWPALHGGFLWDDDVHISANPTLYSPGGLPAIWIKPGATCQYYPLTFTAFWLAYQFWGLNTFGYHLLTVSLHAVTSILLWLVLVRLRVRGALLAAAIFAVHPVNVMSVAWMTELKNTLSAGLALGAALTYLQFAGLEAEERNSKWGCYSVALALFVLALFAKTAASFLPITLFLIIWWKRERLVWRDVLPLLPVLGIAMAMGALTIYFEQHAGGARGKGFNLTLPERLLVSGHSFWFYLGKLFFPHPLTFGYQRWRIASGVWWQYLYPLATGGLLAALWFARRRVGKGLFVAFTHFYVATSLLILFVVLYMTRYTYVSDHWQYFGCMSIIAVAASGITNIVERGLGRNASLGKVVTVAIPLLLSVLTWRQAGNYRNAEILWRTTLAENPQSWFGEVNLAAVVLEQGKIDEALAHLENAHELNSHVPEVHNGLATVFMRMGRTGEALSESQESLALDPRNVEANRNLGAILLEEGRVEEGAVYLQKAVDLDPNYVEAYSDLGFAFSQMGKLSESLAMLQRALQLNPRYAAAHYNIANTLLQLARPNEAIAHLEQALLIDPDDAGALNNMAWILATCPEPTVRDGPKSVTLASRADSLTGGRNPVILATLAAAFAEAGHFTEALAAADRALEAASNSGNNALANDIRGQIQLYQSGQPIRDHRYFQR